MQRIHRSKGGNFLKEQCKLSRAQFYERETKKLITFFRFHAHTLPGKQFNNAEPNSFTCKKYYRYIWFSFSYSLHLLACRLIHCVALPCGSRLSLVQWMLESVYVSNLLSIPFKTNLWTENYSVYFVQMWEAALPRKYRPSNNQRKNFFIPFLSSATVNQAFMRAHKS